MRSASAGLLWLLVFAFFLRILGQALVAFLNVGFLPPMAEWYSGLMPYSALLPTQLLILAVQVKIGVDIQRGWGFFAGSHPKVGRFLCWFSYVYFASMVIRYVVTMGMYPERRWFHGTIPIFFHCVLAAYLYLLGQYYKSSDEQPVNARDTARMILRSI